MKPKHSELMKDFADGYEIEYLSDDGLWHFDFNPQWHNSVVYRRKPVSTPARIAETEFGLKIILYEEGINDHEPHRFVRWVSDIIYVDVKPV